MKGLFYLSSICLLSLGFAAAALADVQESNTVPSNQLMTDLSVVRTGSESDVAAQATFLKAPSQQDQGPELLRISANESVTFSVGDTAVACHEAETCHLPFVKDGVYKVDIKRFNGDAIHTEVKLPQETHITSPTENATFGKDEAIEFDWTPSASPEHGISLSVFLGGLNCDTTGSITWDKDFAAVAPAGYVGNCEGPVKARFTVFYVNVAGVPGVAGGALKGYSLDNLHFTYTDPAISLSRAPLASTRNSESQELRDVLHSINSKSNSVILKR
jgi:hypothetical protein